jgi:predicted AAA+ superfamily ATPase
MTILEYRQNQVYHQDMSVLKRNQAKRVNDLLEKFPIVLILGVRQCGKSTLAKEVRSDWKYFDLERTKDFDYVTSDIDFFLKENNTKLILDEAQQLPEIFKNLRGLVDLSPDETNRFILTGSSFPELIKMASDSLAGRIGIIELGTFKINEIIEEPLPEFYSIFQSSLSKDTINQLKTLTFPSKPLDVLDFFLKGGYPAPVLKKNQEYFEDWMENYFQTYINRDIRRLFPKLDTLKYRRFISMLSELSGTIINKAQLGRSLDVNEVTIRDYLEIAHNTFFWRMIPSFEKTMIKSVTKMPKGILRDSGILHYLSNIDSREKLLRSPKFGQNFESFIIEEIIKGLQASPVRRWDYYYFRTKNGVEIDLILDGKFGTLPIEIKSGSSTTITDVRSLEYFVEKQDLPLGIVVNNDVEIKMLSEKIIQIPSMYI